MQINDKSNVASEKNCTDEKHHAIGWVRMTFGYVFVFLGFLVLLLAGYIFVDYTCEMLLSIFYNIGFWHSTSHQVLLVLLKIALGLIAGNVLLAIGKKIAK